MPQICNLVDGDEMRIEDIKCWWPLIDKSEADLVNTAAPHTVKELGGVPVSVGNGHALSASTVCSQSITKNNFSASNPPALLLAKACPLCRRDFSS